MIETRVAESEVGAQIVKIGCFGNQWILIQICIIIASRAKA